MSGEFEKEVKQALDKIGDQIKEAGQEALHLAQKGVQLGEDQKGRIDEMLVKQGELTARLDEVEQKAARRGAPAEQEEKSVGQRFVDNEDFQKFAAGDGRKNFQMGFKAVTSDTGSAGRLVRTDRIQAPPSMMMLPERRMTIRDLIAPGRTSSNAIEYVRQNGFTNAAAIQAAEGDTKPTSNITFELIASQVRTIAHILPASKQILDDAPMLQSMIDEQMRYGLMLAEENQILMGSGTGANLNGIYTQATAYAQPAGSFVTGGTPTAIDQIRLAILQVMLSEYAADGIVLNPTQWAAIETLKDTEGRYIIGNPQGSISPTLWGRPVVETQAMTNDKFLVGAFRMGAQLFDREDANVQISTENKDNFETNMVTVRAEERLALAVYRTPAFVKGDLGFVA